MGDLDKQYGSYTKPEEPKGAQQEGRKQSLAFAAMGPSIIVSRDDRVLLRNGRLFVTEIEQVGASTTYREIDVTDHVREALR